MPEPVKRFIDLRGLLCPMPIIKIARAFREMNVGDLLEGGATDPAIAADIPAWCKTTGHELVMLEKVDILFHFIVRKTR